MSTIIEKLTARIEEYYATNKNPCKNYATEEAAKKATKKMAQEAATYFDLENRKDAPEADYVVFYVEKMGRWVGCINLSELLHRANSTGGYLGFCRNFFTW